MSGMARICRQTWILKQTKAQICPIDGEADLSRPGITDKSTRTEVPSGVTREEDMY